MCVCGVPMDLVLGSRLNISIFSFELLFAALRAAQTPKGPPSNSVKRQVRHKLIIRRVRIIASNSQAHTHNTLTHTCMV